MVWEHASSCQVQTSVHQKKKKEELT
jgi:hypothetical protein